MRLLVGFLMGVALCTCAEFEGAAFKANFRHSVDTYQNADWWSLFDRVGWTYMIGFVVFLVIVHLHKFPRRLVAIGALVGLALSALVDADNLDLMDITSKHVPFFALRLIGIGLIVTTIFTVLAAFFDERGFWGSMKAWLSD